jgi:hypothetical protein
MRVQPQRQRGQTQTLVEQAQRLMHESTKLVEQREAHAKRLERFVDERGTFLNEMLQDTAIRATPL